MTDQVGHGSLPELSEHSPAGSQTGFETNAIERLRLEIEYTKLRIQLEQLQLTKKEPRQQVDNSDGNTEPPVRTTEYRLDLPKREIQRFDGNPRLYGAFVKEFQSIIERKTRDSTTCLTYLIQYCDGKAKEAIQHCAILDADEGLRRAKEILRKRFGQNYMVARAFIDKLIDGPQIKADDNCSVD